MRIVVTGATGFIGVHLARLLREQNHDVVATGRVEFPAEKTRAETLQREGIELRAGSLLTLGFPAQLVNGCDAVIHLAAAQHEGNVPDSYFHDVNVSAHRVLLEAAVSAGVRRFVYGSTIGIYGSAINGMLDEQTTPRPENVYARTKLEAEVVTAEYAGRIETCIARISETYGPGDLRLLKLFRGIDNGAFFMIGNGRNLRQVIYVEDLVRGLLLGATQPEAVGQTVVLAGTEIMTTNEMVQQIAAALGRKSSSLRLPIWPFRAAAAVLEATLRPMGIQPPLTQRRLDFFTKSFTFSTTKSRSVLGFVPQVSFAAGAALTAAWYRENGLVGRG
jgi:nucleoside-diphosphate-sugar epimerase